MKNEKKSFRVYRGSRFKGETVVTVNAKPLAPRMDLANHSPCGFEWGYLGSAPAQLALAILADCTDDRIALRYYQDYKRDVISLIKNDLWEINQKDIENWLLLYTAKQHKGSDL